MFNRLKAPKRYVSKITQVGLMWFLVSMSIALVSTIWPIYVRGFVGSDALVGLLSGIFTLLSLFLYLYLVPVISKIENSKIYTYSLILKIGSYIAFALLQDVFSLIIVWGISILSYVLRSNSFGIIVRNESSLKNIGKNEGFVYTLTNLGWMIGPFVTSGLLFFFVKEAIFLFSAVMIFVSFLSFKSMKLKEFRKYELTEIKILENTKEFFKMKGLRKLYFVRGGVSFWWGVIFLYVPLFIISNGLSIVWVGAFLGAVSIPLVLLEYSIGKVSDKEGAKKWFIRGYSIMFLSAIFSFFIPDIKTKMVLLAFASVGVAMIEPTTETLFFKLVKRKQERRFYGPYYTNVDLMSSVSRLLCAGVLVFAGEQFVYLTLAIAMLVFLFISTSVREPKKRVISS